MSKLKKYTIKYSKEKELWAAIPNDKLEQYLGKGFARGEDSRIIYSDDIFTLYKFIDK